MTKSSDLKQLLTHPVIVVFLTMKWRQYNWLYWVNLAFFFYFAGLFLLHIVADYYKISDHPFFSMCTYYLLTIVLILSFLRELFQLCTQTLKYFKSIDNYLELALMGITFFLLLDLDIPNLYQRKRELWSVSIILLSFELMAMLGRHPYFSTRVVMLKTVCYNFFSAFLSYSLLIVAFATSFYILFDTDTNAQDEVNEENFGNLGKSIFKTIVMLTGEFDSSSINFNSFFISKVLFVFFIIMMNLILLNLLNGLAVNDTQAIRNDAELFGYIARTEYIRNIEIALNINDLPLRLMNMLWHSSKPDFSQTEKYKFMFYPNKNSLFCSVKSKYDDGCHTYYKHMTLNSETIETLNEIITEKKKIYRKNC